jgi:hypothetical protein
LIQTFEQYVNYTNNLVSSNRYERDDFTVVVQPFMQDMEIPKDSKGNVDLSYFAPGNLKINFILIILIYFFSEIASIFQEKVTVNQQLLYGIICLQQLKRKQLNGI